LFTSTAAVSVTDGVMLVSALGRSVGFMTQRDPRFDFLVIVESNIIVTAQQKWLHHVAFRMNCWTLLWHLCTKTMVRITLSLFSQYCLYLCVHVFMCVCFYVCTHLGVHA